MNPTKTYTHQQYKLNLQDEMETLLDSFLKDVIYMQEDTA